MLRKLLRKEFIVVSSLICSLGTSQFVGASSIYDNDYQYTNNLKLQSYGYGVNCAEEDITTSWIDVIRDPSSWAIGTNADSIIKRDAAIASFEEAFTNGYWGVSQFTNNNGTTIIDKEVSVFWSEGKTSQVEFLDEGRVGLNSDGTNDVYQAGIVFSQWARSSGGCEPIVFYYSHGHNPGSAAFLSNSWGNSYGLANYFVNAPVNYPSGYEGALIPFRQIAGTVECFQGDGEISNILINAQSGMDGNAKISNGNPYGKEYEYLLTEDSDYSLVVMCDGEPYYGPTVDVDHYNSYNWICTKSNDLNICAAS